MKKLLLVAAVAAFTMTSCKKDYVCTCKDNSTVDPEDFTTKYSKVKKKDAEAKCTLLNTFWSPDYTCTLK
jgi:hypothetical protein